MKKKIELEVISSLDIEQYIDDKEISAAWIKAKEHHKNFIIEYLSNGNNGKNAYLKTINPKASINVACVCAYQILNYPSIGRLVRYLSRMGTHQIALANKAITEALEATCNNMYSTSKGKDKDSIVEGEGVFPDHNIRLKAAEMIMKSTGSYIQKTEISGEISVVHEYEIPKLVVPVVDRKELPSGDFEVE